MKENELMIGDWIKPKNVDGYFKAGLIGTDTIGNDTDTAEWDLDEIEPIPLTAEILEKNGWDGWCELSKIAKSCVAMFDNDTSISFQIVDGYKSIYTQIKHCGAGTFEFRKHLFYIHELQHALRLCGIDKEIVL